MLSDSDSHTQTHRLLNHDSHRPFPTFVFEKLCRGCRNDTAHELFAPSAKPGQDAGPSVAYVGTFSSPLRDMLPTQVDLPPGNGRGIHLFRVDRTSGAMAPAGIHEMGTSPSCLVLNASGTRLYSANETDRVGENKEGPSAPCHRSSGRETDSRSTPLHPAALARPM